MNKNYVSDGKSNKEINFWQIGLFQNLNSK